GAANASAAVNAASGRSAPGTRAPQAPVRLNAVNGSPLYWHPDSQSLYCELVPDDAGPPPAAPLAIEPIVQENDGQTAQVRTFKDLLKNPHDEALLEYYLTAQPARIAVADHVAGRAVPLGAPRMVAR